MWMTVAPSCGRGLRPTHGQGSSGRQVTPALGRRLHGRTTWLGDEAPHLFRFPHQHARPDGVRSVTTSATSVRAALSGWSPPKRLPPPLLTRPLDPPDVGPPSHTPRRSPLATRSWSA